MDMENFVPEPEKEKKKKAKPFIVFAVVLLCIAGISYGLQQIKKASTPTTNADPSSYTLEKATDSKLSIQKIVAMNADAVVEIKTNSFSGAVAGSGVIINKQGYIITNHHVIENAQVISVTLHNGKKYSASLVGSDLSNDIAVIKINGSDFTSATYGNSDEMQTGDLAVVIGNPLGTLGGTVTAGIVSALDRQIVVENTGLTVFQTDAAVNPGNSGGGVFDDNGHLIGIVVAKASNAEGLGYAIPINKAASIASDLIKNGKVTEKPAIGINLEEVTEDYAQYETKEPGIYIVEVVSPEAKSAGFKSGDRILSIDNKNVTSRSELHALIQKHKVGDTISIEIERDNKPVTIKTTLINSYSK